eukprot:TRINITY_DN40551_c0_g1_i1.p2 TRINITY_DN40551_c0_g1~~TRINITY_DN40551_c0_g1_i1.p2  ORF type:complete len:145 (-),score=18.63 TRINITY_DN40551_c0_g1_i1:609-1043(-)
MPLSLLSEALATPPRRSRSSAEDSVRSDVSCTFCASPRSVDEDAPAFFPSKTPKGESAMVCSLVCKKELEKPFTHSFCAHCGKADVARHIVSGEVFCSGECKYSFTFKQQYAARHGVGMAHVPQVGFDTGLQPVAVGRGNQRRR